MKIAVAEDNSLWRIGLDFNKLEGTAELWIDDIRITVVMNMTANPAIMTWMCNLERGVHYLECRLVDSFASGTVWRIERI